MTFNRLANLVVTFLLWPLVLVVFLDEILTRYDTNWDRFFALDDDCRDWLTGWR